jgi:hypothetical protein
LLCADDINFLGDNTNTIKEKTETFLGPSGDVDLEINAEKTKYMIISHHQNIRIANESFENMTKFKYLGMTQISGIHNESRSTLNSRNACYHSVQNLLSSHLISRRLKIKIHRNVILPLVQYGCKTWTLNLREEQRLRVFEKRVLKIFGPRREEKTA